MTQEWDGNEMEFDEAPTRGSHRIKSDDIRFLPQGVEMEVDCPNCEYTVPLQIPWKEVIALAVRQARPPIYRVQGGFAARIICENCEQRYLEQGVPSKQARKGSTSLVDWTYSEVKRWFDHGVEGKRISPAAKKYVKDVLAGVRQPLRPRGQAGGRPQGQAGGRPQARRRNALTRRGR